MSTLQYQEAAFTGLDTFHDASKLAPGMLAACDNLLVDGKSLIVRPGKKGMLTTPFGAPIYEPCPFVKADATTDIVFTTGGRLYHAAKGAASAGEILKGGVPFALNSPGVFLERAGKYLYGVDGVGVPFRTDLAGGSSVTGLTAPAAPAAALTSTVIDAMTGTAGWVADTLSGTYPGNVFPNGDFSTGLSLYPVNYGPGESGGTTAGGFNFAGPDVDFHNTGSSSNPLPAGYAGTWALLDDAAEGFALAASVPGDTVAGDTSRNGTQLWVKVPYYQNDPNGVEGVRIEVRAYSTTAAVDATDLLAVHQAEYAPPFANQSVGQYFDRVFTFPGLSSEIKSFRIGLYGAGTNKRGAGVFVSGVQALLLGSGLALSPGAGGLQVTHAEPSDAYRGKVGGSRITRDFGANRDWTGGNILTLGLSGVADLAQQGALRFRFALRASGAAVTYATNPCTVAADGSGASVDITTIPLSVRQAARDFEVIFDADLPLTALRSPLMTVGPLTSAGNLTVGRADYLYRVTEIDASADPTALLNIIQSNPSPFSVALTPTVTQAEAALTLGARVNAAATHMGIYRAGGVYSDGLSRLVAFVSLSDDTIRFGDGALVTWDHTGRRFVDNTPDSFLEEADAAPTGHDAAPAGAQCIAFWQGRICLAVGSRLYISNLIDDDRNAGLYFPVVNDPNDPTAAVQGANFPVGGQDNDAIARLIAYGSHLIVLKGRSIWVCTGVDAADFSVQSYLLKAGVGCVAPRAAGIVGNHIWFRSATGLMQFDADVVDPVSVAVEKTIALASAYPGCALAYHGRRMYLFSPDAGASANSVSFVYDERQNGYTRYLQMGVTGAASLSGGQDTDDFYLAGLDGQLYHLSDSGDQATPAAAVVPVAFSLATRGFHDGSLQFASVPTHVYFGTISRETVALTLGVKDADSAAASAPIPYTVGGTDAAPLHARPAPLRVGGGLRAAALQVTISGSAARPFRILSLGLTATGGRRLAA